MLNKKSLYPAILVGMVFLPGQAHAGFFDFFTNIFDSRAGGNVVKEDGEDQYDLSKFKKNNCEKHNLWNAPIIKDKEKNTSKVLFICVGHDTM